MSNKLITLTLVALFSACNLGWSDADQLFVSSREGDHGKVKELLARGVDVNHRFIHLQRDFQPYETALIVAAEKGHLDIVKTLVKAGAKLEMINTYSSETALYKAVKNRHKKVIDYLLKVGSDPMVKDSPEGTDCLMLAVIQNDYKLIKKLVAYGAWPDPTHRTGRLIKGEVGRTAISIAKALRRPYVGYLKAQKARCNRVLKSKTSCATKKVARLKEKNTALDF